jgi:nucleoside-diphosphate-sugar epimerase
VLVKALIHRHNRDSYISKVANIEIVEGDVTDYERMESIIAGCAYVVHCAATFTGSLEDYRRVNVSGTRNITQAAVNANVTRIVHVSSISVYGYKNKFDVTETTPIAPAFDPYSISKAEGETALKQVAESHGLSYCIVRPGMIYGPRGQMWVKGLFKIARRNPTIFIGSGSGSIYTIHIDDVVDMLVTLITHPNAVGEVFNCTPDPSPTWREFLGGYSELAGHSRWVGLPPVLLRPGVSIAKWLASDESRNKDLPDLLSFLQRYIIYKMDKAQDSLDWRPQIDWWDGIKSCKPYLREQGLLR